MKTEVTPSDKLKNETQGAFSELDPENITQADADSDSATELCEDMEMVSPGAMLLEAREALSLSQEHIANRLNFKVSLVKDIEDDNFDPMLPATFNRGYLANYAKLVGIDVVDVLASYDALDAATIQRSEMLSFSKETTKQAEYSRVMWLSYLIVAVFVGLTILWWIQESKQQDLDTFLAEPEAPVIEKNESVKEIKASDLTEFVADDAKDIAVVEQNITEQVEDDNSVATANEIDDSVASADTILSESLQVPKPVLSTAVFTFKGDCWVNIFDANGERIAWGVKKAGYVMPITAEAPLKITVGKPELATITFNGETVDMSSFNTGNIAKFNLPFGEYAN